MRLYLASTSPARLALLRASGIEPETVSPGVDELAVVAAAEAQAGPLAAEDMVQLLARAKAEAVIAENAVARTTADRTPAPDTGVSEADPIRGDRLDGLVLGGDSAFVLDGVIYGKPHTAEVARERWQLQRGRTGLLYSGHWLIDHRHGQLSRAVGAVSVASVTFASDIDDDELDAYIATGEPLRVAGAFTVDSLGAPFVTSIQGDPSTVVGLSLPTLRRLVRQLGIDWSDLWSRA